MSYTQVLTTVLHSPTKKRAQVSPVIYVFLGILVLYFMWRDVDLLVTLRKCDNSNVTQDITVTSVKSLLQPPTIHYLELPLSEIMELELGLSSFVSPNTVSFSGVLIGLTAALLICQNRRLATLAGVTLYKLRDLADSLDGVLARGAGVAMLPTPGTSGYYIDGWCDIISETALIYSVGVVILRDREKSWQGFRTSSKSLLTTSGLRSQLATLTAPLTMDIWGLGLQSILAAVGLTWTTLQLHQGHTIACPGPPGAGHATGRAGRLPLAAAEPAHADPGAAGQPQPGQAGPVGRADQAGGHPPPPRHLRRLLHPGLLSQTPASFIIRPANITLIYSFSV